MGNKKGNVQAMPPPDAEEIFKQAAFFDYATMVLGNDNDRRLQFLALAGQHGITEQGRAREVALQSGELSLVPCAIPNIVNSVLTSELYLKCLLTLQGTAFRHIHEIEDLYDAVNPSRKKRIKEIYEGLFDRVPYLIDMRKLASGRAQFGFEDVLKQLNKAFIEWRYIFQYPGDRSGAAHNVLRCALRQMVLEIKPDWEKLLPALGMPPTSPRR